MSQHIALCPQCGQDHAASVRLARDRPGPAALEFHGLTVCRGGVTVLDKVEALVPQGGSTMIIGPNGAGKTTLLMALLGELRYSGTIRFSQASVEPIDGKRPRSFLNLTARIAYSFASSGVKLVRLAAITDATCLRLSSLIAFARIA